MSIHPRRNKQSTRGTTIILVLIIILFMITLAVSFLRGMGLQRDLSEGLRRNAILDNALFSAKSHAVQEIETYYRTETDTTETIRSVFDEYFNDTTVSDRAGPLGDPADADYAEKNMVNIWTWDPGLSDEVPEDFRTHQTDARWHEIQYFDNRYRQVDNKGDARYVVRYAYAVMELSGRLQVNPGKLGPDITDRYIDSEPQWRANNINVFNGNIINIKGTVDPTTAFNRDDEPDMSKVQFAARHLARGLQFYEGPGISAAGRTRQASVPGERLSKNEIEAGFIHVGSRVRRMNYRLDPTADSIEYEGEHDIPVERKPWPYKYMNDLFNWSLIRTTLYQKGTASEQASYGLSTVGLDSWPNVIASLYTPFGQADTIDSLGGDSIDNYQWIPNINTAPPATIRAMIAAIDACLDFENRYMDPGEANQTRAPRDGLKLIEANDGDPAADPPIPPARASVSANVTDVRYYPLNPGYDHQANLVRAYNGEALPAGNPDAPATVQLTSAQQAELFENVEVGDNFETITVINPDGIGINTIADVILDNRPFTSATYKEDLKTDLTYKNIVHWIWAWKDTGGGNYEWVRLLDLGIGGPINTASYIDPRIEALLDGNEWGLRLGRRRSRFHRAVIRAEVFDTVEDAPIQARVQEFALHVDPSNNGNTNDSYFVYHVDRGRGLEGEAVSVVPKMIWLTRNSENPLYNPATSLTVNNNPGDKERVLDYVGTVRWRASSGGTLITHDFGYVADVRELHYHFRGVGGDAGTYYVEYSTNGADWVIHAQGSMGGYGTVNGGPSNSWVGHVSFDARYVRIRSPDYRYGIGVFEAKGVEP